MGQFTKLRLSVIAFFYFVLMFHCFFSGLSAAGFVGPDEPRYASIAREMARSGDWITPGLNGEPWFEKPPLYYWSAAVGFRLFSSPEVAARSPSGVYALLAVLGIVLLARRVYGPAVAAAAAWILPATVATTGFAHAAATDMPFAACLTLAVVAAAYLLLDEQPARLRLCAGAFGAALGLAVLAKGPAAIVLAGGSTALWAVATGNVRRSLRLFHPLALMMFFVVALPWYALCAARNPDFLRVFLLEHNVERFLTNRYQHQQPFWFFAPILLIAVFPWTLLLVPAIGDGWRALRSAEWRKSPGAFFAAWVIFPFAFFSASQSKLPGYILPVIPPLVVLLARAIVGDEETAVSGPKRRALWVAISFIAGGIVPIVSLFLVTRGYVRAPLLDPGALNAVLILLGVTLWIGGIAAAVLSRLRGPILVAAVAASVFSAGLAGKHVLPLLDADISPRGIAMAARERAAGGAIAVYNLPRAWQFGCEFYLERSLPEWTPAMPHPVWVITVDRGIEALEREGLRMETTERPSRMARLVRVE